MKNVGVVAIIVGILLIILNLAGLVGAGSRTPLLAAIVVLMVGLFLYRRHAKS